MMIPDWQFSYIDENKVWIRSPSGEGGSFDRIAAVLAYRQGRLNDFFWENF